MEVLLVLLGKGLSETEEFKRNWPGRTIDCRGAHSRQRDQKLKELSVLLEVGKIMVEGGAE